MALLIKNIPPTVPYKLDGSLVFFHHVPRELRPGNPNRAFWQWEHEINMHSFHCGLEEYSHDQCWGWTFLRTSYEDDEKFARAISTIHRLGLVSLEKEYWDSRTRGKPDNEDVEALYKKLEESLIQPGLYQHIERNWRSMVEPARVALPAGEPLTGDWVITHELMRRYHNTFIQDRQALGGASVEEAWKYFRSSVSPDDDDDDNHSNGAMRSDFFIHLDKASIDFLADAPTLEEMEAMTLRERQQVATTYWVKGVSSCSETNDDGESTDEMIEYPLGRRRLRLIDFFTVLMDLVHVGGLEEISSKTQSWEEWLFCDPYWSYSLDPSI